MKRKKLKKQILSDSHGQAIRQDLINLAVLQIGIRKVTTDEQSTNI